MNRVQVFLYPASMRTVHGIKWGYINANGHLIISPRYERAYDFQCNGLAIVQFKEKYGIINLQGQYVVPPKYDSMDPFSEHRAIVMDEEGFHVMDEQGNILTSKAYRFLSDYQEGRAKATIELKGIERYGYLDLQGREVIPFQYQSASDFKEGKAVVQMEKGKYALIDLEGRILQIYPYAFVGDLGEGLLAFQVEENEKYGFIDLKGNIIILPKYTGVQPFTEGRSIVNMGEDYIDKYGLIDKYGHFVLLPIYDDMYLLRNQRIAIGKAMDPQKPYLGKKYGVSDINGHICTGFWYTQISPYHHGLASASDGNSTFFINDKGMPVYNLPIVEGSGELVFKGDIIQGDVDYRIFYMNQRGIGILLELLMECLHRFSHILI